MTGNHFHKNCNYNSVGILFSCDLIYTKTGHGNTFWAVIPDLQSVVFVVMVKPGQQDSLPYTVDVTTQGVSVDRRQAQALVWECQGLHGARRYLS